MYSGPSSTRSYSRSGWFLFTLVPRREPPPRARVASLKRMRLQQALLLMLLLALQGAMAVHEARHAAIMSTRGIQYKDPWISDDFVVGCIMIMFLLLFCFGKQ